MISSKLVLLLQLQGPTRLKHYSLKEVLSRTLNMHNLQPSITDPKETEALITFSQASNSLSWAFSFERIPWLTEVFGHYSYPYITSPCKQPARTENNDFHRFFSKIQIGITKRLKWQRRFPNPLCIHSMCFPCVCLRLSQWVCVCGRGEASSFHGSSQPLAQSAAKWVAVYPLPQLRVLMCDSVYVESVNVFAC